MSAETYGQERLRALFESIDRADAEGFSRFLSEDASFRFGSAPAVAGRAAIVTAVGEFFSTISACRHELANTIARGDTLVCEGTVTYTRHDNSTVTLPFVDIFEISNGLIDEYKIYIDAGPLYAG